MGMNVFLCITPTAQMSRKRYYLCVNACSAVWLLFSIIDSTATGFSAKINRFTTKFTRSEKKSLD